VSMLVSAKSAFEVYGANCVLKRIKRAGPIVTEPRRGGKPKRKEFPLYVGKKEARIMQQVEKGSSHRPGVVKKKVRDLGGKATRGREKMKRKSHRHPVGGGL